MSFDLAQGTYAIRISAAFESSHFLYRYFADGSDEPMHGHSWQVEIFIFSSQLENGISMDFIPVKQALEKVCSQLDHICLNELEVFREHNPTSENIARYIFGQLQKEVSSAAFLKEIRVWEGPQNYASFFPAKI